MLPETKIVMVAGNHDTPRTSETGCILRLFSQLGITVVDGEPRWVPVDEYDLKILAVPDMAQGRPRLEPDPTARYNILLLHGEIEGVLPKYGRELDRSPMEITLDELAAHKWDYVALGHYHVYRAVAQNAFYSGSLDYTSTNPWGELAEERDTGIGGKGIIEHDLANRTHKFIPIPPSRRWIDLTPLSGAGLSPASLDEAIRDALDNCEDGIDNKIVRLVVRDVPRHILRELDHKALRDYKRKALHFHLDTRRPEIVRPEKADRIPAVRHVDGTARIQTVNRQQNPPYYVGCTHRSPPTWLSVPALSSAHRSEPGVYNRTTQRGNQRCHTSQIR